MVRQLDFTLSPNFAGLPTLIDRIKKDGMRFVIILVSNFFLLPASWLLMLACLSVSVCVYGCMWVSVWVCVGKCFYSWLGNIIDVLIQTEV